MQPAHLDPRSLPDRGSARPDPWTPDHVAAVLVANGIGIVLVFAGWWESSGLGRAHDQLPWVNLATLGLLIAGGANGWWLARTRRVIVAARSAVLPFPPTSFLHAVPAAVAGNGHYVGAAALARPFRPRQPRPTGPTSNGGLVAGSAMSRYHRASCLLVAGKEVKVAGRAEHEAVGREPCEVCQP